MYKGERNTGKWFQVDHQPNIQERQNSSKLAPGLYDNLKGLDQVSPNRQISWNIGKIPFGSGKDRFAVDYRQYFRPGPSNYDPKNLTAPSIAEKTSPLGSRMGATSSMQGLIKGEASQDFLRTQSISMLDSASQQIREVIQQNKTSSFKSKAPKTSIYDAEEKRIRSLLGPKPGLKYQIKLNDQILDKERTSYPQELQSQMTSNDNLSTTQQSIKGKLILGSNYRILDKKNSTDEKRFIRNEDLFGVGKKIIVGPQDYDPKILSRKSPQVIIKNESTIGQGTVKKQMESYLSTIFEKDKQTAERKKDSEEEEKKNLEKIAPFCVDKRDVSYKSNIKRDPLAPSKHTMEIPQPGQYDSKLPKKELTVSRNYKHFGSTSPRTSMIGRNVTQNPFSDPTRMNAPPPNFYQQNNDSQKKKAQVLNQVGINLGGIANEANMTNAFQSPTKRDFLEQVSKVQRENPGPGAYDTQIQEKLKTLNYQLSSRYHMRPFGTGTARFNSQTEKPQRQTVDFNQTISVKDPEIMDKRKAFLTTIQMHKKNADTRKNAIFASTADRFPNKTSQEILIENAPYQINLIEQADSLLQQNDKNKYLRSGSIGYPQNESGFFDPQNIQSKNSMGQIQNDIHSQTQPNIYKNLQLQNQFLKIDNNHGGFNSTTERFTYQKDYVKSSEVPGPGSYNLRETQTQFTSTGRINEQSGQIISSGRIALKQGLNTISSSGDRAFYNQQSKYSNFNAKDSSPGIVEQSSGHAIPIMQQENLQRLSKQFATIGSSMFKNQTKREDFAHYIPQNHNNTAALKNLGPGSYFNQQAPFLKRSFNASLPLNKFY